MGSGSQAGTTLTALSRTLLVGGSRILNVDATKRTGMQDRDDPGNAHQRLDRTRRDHDSLGQVGALLDIAADLRRAGDPRAAVPALEEAIDVALGVHAPQAALGARQQLADTWGECFVMALDAHDEPHTVEALKLWRENAEDLEDRPRIVAALVAALSHELTRTVPDGTDDVRRRSQQSDHPSQQVHELTRHLQDAADISVLDEQLRGRVAAVLAEATAYSGRGAATLRPYLATATEAFQRNDDWASIAEVHERVGMAQLAHIRATKAPVGVELLRENLSAAQAAWGRAGNPLRAQLAGSRQVDAEIMLRTNTVEILLLMYDGVGADPACREDLDMLIADVTGQIRGLDDLRSGCAQSIIDQFCRWLERRGFLIESLEVSRTLD